MKSLILPAVAGVLLLSGCAGVKSEFDCGATTSDTCMTMSSANQLARDRAAKPSGKPGAGALPPLVNLPAPAGAAVTPVPVSAVHSPAARPAVTSGTGVPEKTQRPRPVTRVPVQPSALHPVTAPSCQSVRCDSPGSVRPQRTQDRVATVWIAPWVDSDNAFHQPGRVSFVVSPSDWVLPSRVN